MSSVNLKSECVQNFELQTTVSHVDFAQVKGSRNDRDNENQMLRCSKNIEKKSISKINASVVSKKFSELFS